jgi:hypothetical protein
MAKGARKALDQKRAWQIMDSPKRSPGLTGMKETDGIKTDCIRTGRARGATFDSDSSIRLHPSTICRNLSGTTFGMDRVTVINSVD